MSTQVFDVELLMTVRVTVNDPDVIERVLQNKDDEGVPQPRQKGGSGWRDHLYDLTARDAVLKMLARNIGVHGRLLRSLDGWADMDNEACDAWETGCELLDVTEVVST